ncbi:MAG: DMT family transporter [Candidatus Thermoplasmatota archaeon]|nr:DMT family transporter [Candidatus Thermoplasmatota archaeon]
MVPRQRDVRPGRPIIDRMSGLAILCMVLFGTSFWGLVLALEVIPPVTLGFLRAFLVSVFMLSMFFLLGRFGSRNGLFARKNLLLAGLEGKGGLVTVVCFAFFSTVLPNILQNLGMTMMDPGSTSSLTAMIQGVGPVFTIILAVIFLHEKLGPWKLAGLLVTVPAAMVLTTYGSGQWDLGSSETIGAFLNLITGLSYSISGLILKYAMNRGASPVHLVSVNAMYGAAILLPVTVFTWIMGWEGPAWIFHAGADVWLALFYISICLYGVTPTIWYRVIRSGELSRVGFFVFLLPVFSYLVGFFMLGDRLGPVQLGAGCVLLAGVGISQIRRKRILNPDIDG